MRERLASPNHIPWLVSWLLFFLVPADCLAQDAVPLPVRKVVLYKNGMGYFEHLGSIRGRQSVAISLPRTQLNDVLKSLTVIDLGGGEIAGVTYDSTAPLERRLAELPIDLGAAQNLVGFLNQIRGAEVAVRSPGGNVGGRLMGAETRHRSSAGMSVEVVEASILTPAGELKLVELESVAALEFTDPGFAGELTRYLDLLNSRHQRDVRRLRIQTIGSGERQLYVGYTSESPIWKTTYRIVLDSEEKPLLQGWAIVDNTTPMDWENVSLSLVAGAPVSFVQNLSQPVYARRPVVPLPEGVEVSPQLHEGTLELPSGQTAISGIVYDSGGGPVPAATIFVLTQEGEQIGRTTSDAAGRFQVVVPPGVYRVRLNVAGFQSQEFSNVRVTPGRMTALNLNLQGLEGAQLFAAGEPARSEEERPESKLRRDSRLLAARPGAATAETMEVLDEVGKLIRQEAPAAAQAQALGEQFEYTLPQPVTIRRIESGLLPIIHSEIEGEKVSLYSAGSGEGRPRLAVWIKNTSGLTLDAGSFTVIDSNAFAGEGLVETIQPDESRLLSYALDLGVEVSANTQVERQRIERVEISRGVLRMHSRQREERGYVIRNNDSKDRTIVVEHPVRGGWGLVDTPAPVESSTSYHRFRVEAKAKTTTELSVREETPRQTTYAVTNITPEQIALWITQRSIDAEIERALAAVVAQKGEVAELDQKIAALENEQREIFSDQERVRGNLQRLGRTPEEANLRQRYIRQMEDQEDRLAVLRAERDRLADEREQAQRRLDEMLQEMTFDRRM